MKSSKPARFPRRNFFHLLAALGVLTAFAWTSDAPAAETTGTVPAKVIRVACVGDSITYGAGIKDRRADSYPAVLGRWLGKGWDVRNFGVSGATVLKKGDRPYFLQKAHGNALAFAPDIVVIMLGTNDSKHRGPGSLGAEHAVDNWQYKADYVPDYEELIAEFRRANPQVKVYVCLPTPCFPGRWGINNQTIHDEIIPRVRQVATDSNASIIDLNTALAGKKNLFPDTVHPNPAGAKLMAATIYRALTGNAAPADAP
jgi:lysophospholipase L1-like esterase